MNEELRAALDTALRVVLHETLDPKCEGTPPYDETAAMAERVLRTPVVAAALSQPRQEDGLDVFDRIIAQHTPGIETDSDYDFGQMWMTCSCGWDQDRDRVRGDYVAWADHVRSALRLAAEGSDERR